jgi:hypothetical protein
MSSKCACERSPCECKSYEIKPVKIDDVPNTKYLNNFPGLDRLKMIIGAASYAGKTSLIYNLLTNPAFGFKRFYRSNIFLISPTFESDDIYRKAIDNGTLKRDHCYDTYSWSLLQEILEEQKENCETLPISKRPSVLIILDDVAQDLKNENQKRLVNAFSRWRHYRISFIITCQNYRSIPLGSRTNANAVVIFPNRMSETELNAVYEEQSLKKDEWNTVIDTIQKSYPYGFLYMYPEVRSVKDRYFIDFNKKLSFEYK